MLISHDLTAGPELLTIKIRVALTTKSISLDSAAACAPQLNKAGSCGRVERWSVAVLQPRRSVECI